MTEHDLALQVIVFVKVCVHRDLCGVGGEGCPGRRVIGTTLWEQRRKGYMINLCSDEVWKHLCRYVVLKKAELTV